MVRVSVPSDLVPPPIPWRTEDAECWAPSWEIDEYFLWLLVDWPVGEGVLSWKLYQFINDLQFSAWKRTLTHPLEQATMPKGWCQKDHESGQTQGQLLERSKSVCHFFAFGSFRQPLGNMTFDSPRLPKCCAPHLQLPRKSPPARASCFCARALVEDKYSVTVVSNFVWRHPLKPATVLIHLYGKVPCLNLHSTSSAQT